MGIDVHVPSLFREDLCFSGELKGQENVVRTAGRKRERRMTTEEG